MSLPALSVFSPLPPEQNGIADYTFHLLRPLSDLYDCAAFVEDVHAIAPNGVAVRESLQAFRYLSPESRILHQIGNNPGHVFVLEALRKWGGVTTLHDQNLHYLYEVAGTDRATMARRMTATSATMGAAYAAHWHESTIKTKANYVLFDMLDEVLSTSAAVIVHSEFAKRRLALLYRPDRCQNVVVVPHLALPFRGADAAEAALRLNIPEGKPLIVSSGFATSAKRFDWLVAALNEIASRGVEYFWVHAGKERPEEFALSALLDRYPQVKRRCHITGYLTEEDLNTHISACDILINLRFPSVGESSGTLSRAMSAGKCCLVSDTAAYADLPREAVAHVPISNPVPSLVERLEALLIDPIARAKIGRAAQRLADTDWAPAVIAAAYENVIEASRRVAAPSAPRAQNSDMSISLALTAQTTRSEIGRALALRTGIVEVVFVAESLDALVSLSLDTPRLLAKLMPTGFEIQSLRLERASSPSTDLDETASDAAGQILLRLKGNLP
jgi:glycosyltransferase involved in cell wall biosynthesis